MGYAILRSDKTGYRASKLSSFTIVINGIDYGILGPPHPRNGESTTNKSNDSQITNETNFLDERKKSIETDKIQTSIPLALLNLQYTSVNVIMPPSSFIKKSSEKLYVASFA